VHYPGRATGWRRDDGAAAVEFALVSLLLFLVLFGLIEFGIGFFTQQGAAAAAREAARRAAVGKVVTCYGGPGSTDATDLLGIVKSAAGGAFGYFDSPKAATMSKTDTNGNGVVGDAGDTVVVTINYHVDLPFVSAFVPGVKPTLANLTQTGTARIEQKGGATTCS
jgi:Flp pilus assembly protein TadG